MVNHNYYVEFKPCIKNNGGYYPRRLMDKTLDKHEPKHLKYERKRKTALAIGIPKSFYKKIRNYLIRFNLILMIVSLSVSIFAVANAMFAEDEVEYISHIDVNYNTMKRYMPVSLVDIEIPKIEEKVEEEEVVVEDHYTYNDNYTVLPVEPETVEFTPEEDVITESIPEPIEEEIINTTIPEEPVPVVDGDIVTPLAEQFVEGTKIEYLGNYNITGYDPLCDHCCGKHNGITASGTQAEYYKTVAMNGIEFGTKVYIPNYGIFVVEDRGGSKVGVDIACPGHKACYAVTKKNTDVYVIVE